MFITKKEAMEILQINSDRTLRRYVSKYEIETKSNGRGRASLYKETDIHKVFSIVKPNKDKYNPDKAKKAKAKKEQKKVEARELEENKKEVEKVTSTPLNEVGQSEFIRVEQELKDKGLYLEMDRAYILAYSVAYQNYMFYSNLSAQLDHTTTDDSGNVRIHPYLTITDKFFNQMEKAATKLGIGARNRMGLEIKQPKTGMMADILNKRSK